MPTGFQCLCLDGYVGNLCQTGKKLYNLAATSCGTQVATLYITSLKACLYQVLKIPAVGESLKKYLLNTFSY